MEPLVSIIIPTYRRSVTLARAIDSCLAQSYPRIEVIVVDDNAPETEYRTITEQTMAAYAASDTVLYLKHPRNMKGSAARNTGIRASKGDFITFLDDDDVLDREKIALQVQELQSRGPAYGMVCCGVRVVDEDTKKLMKSILPTAEGKPQYNMLRLRLGMGTGSNPMFTRAAVEATGLFDTSFLRHQDTEYVIRVLRSYQMATIPQMLITKHEAGHPNRPSAEKYMEIQKHFLDTFREDILRYSQEEQNEIYRNNYHQSCIVAVDARSWKLARDCYQKATAHGKYTFKMYLGILKHMINSRY